MACSPGDMGWMRKSRFLNLRIEYAPLMGSRIFFFSKDCPGDMGWMWSGTLQHHPLH